MMFALWAVRSFAGVAPVISLGKEKGCASPGARIGVFVLSGFFQGLVAFALIWTFYEYRFGAFSTQLPPRGTSEHSWEEMLGSGTSQGLPARLIDTMREHHVLPEAFLYGLAHARFQVHGNLRSAFLNRELQPDRLDVVLPVHLPREDPVGTPWTHRPGGRSVLAKAKN